MDPFENRMRRKMKIRNRFLLMLPFLLALIIGGLVYVFTYHVNHFSLELNLIGEEHIILEYGQAYEELGAEGRFFGSYIMQEGIAVPVKYTDSVVESKLGTYTVRYEADYERWRAETERTVEIVDTTAPRIWLAEKKGNYVIPGEQYQEEGFMARDNYDGDLTDRVKKTILKDRIIYQVQDSSGNVARVSRRIVYYDPIPPEIRLKGDQSIMIQQGKSYAEPGYTATDNCDGDITDRVKISGSVDTAKPGTYQIHYTVEDSFGNTDTEVRTVRVKEKPKPKPQQSESKPTGKVIYLTFDDGPSKYTEKLLKILKRYNVKATFFVVNTGYAHLIDDIVSAGHSIAAHTYSHEYSEIYASEDAYFADLNKILNVIKKHSGADTKLIRFPGGSSNKVSKFNEGIMTRLTYEVVERGYKYFDWNVDSNDAGGAKTAEKVYENVISGVQGRKISIVLQHDTKSYSVDAVEKIIQWGLENGYQFLPLKKDSPTAAHDLNN